jgi:hypothetical protein
MIRDLHEGWREAIALATERQAVIDAMIREKTLTDKKRDDMRRIVDDLYEASLLLANEVSSRQAINDSTTYKTTTTNTTHDTNATLSVILQRLNSVISIVSTQDIKMTVSKDEIKRFHGLFVSEKRAREDMQRKQREEEEEARQREKENIHHHLQQQQFLPLHSLNCERIIEEEASVITEETNNNNSTTKKKVAKKKLVKK